MFIGRQAELETLEELYDSNKSEFFILYGRRRIGKTTLLKCFIKDKKAIYFTAIEDYPPGESLKHFSEKILEYAGTQNHTSCFESWEKAILYSGELSKKQRLILIIDEYQYLALTNRSISSIIQKIWDDLLKDTNIFLILCGSYMSFMEDEVLGYKSPLYGRRTAQLKLEKMNYREAGQFYKNYNNEEKIIAYGLLDGIPEYLNNFSDSNSIEKNIKIFMLNKSSYLYNETNLLVRQELREPQRYFSIIEAIALGNTKLGEIYTRTMLEKPTINQYITSLKELGVIKREVPVTEKNPLKSKAGIYILTDNYFKFWFKFILPNKSELEENEVEYVYDNKIAPFINDYMGYIFEDICIQFLKINRTKNILPFRFSKIGRWWQKEEEIDIIAFENESVAYCECKWQNKPVGEEVLKNLTRKSALIENSWLNKYFVFFSRTGFTSALIQKSKGEKNIFLFGLNDLF